MSPQDRPEGPTYVLVDGENIDATLGVQILGRRPQPGERPRWERLLDFAQRQWGNEPRALFFLAVGADLPMSFIQALISLGYRPIPLRGDGQQKVVDIAIQRTLTELVSRPGDVMLVSNDGDFVDFVEPLLVDSRRVGVVGFDGFRNHRFDDLGPRGLETFDLEDDIGAFDQLLPRVRVIDIDDFDPAAFL